MKILIISDDFPPEITGGAGVIVFNHAIGLKMAGHDVSVITTTKASNNVGTQIEGGIKIIRIYSNIGERFRSYLSVYNPSVINKIIIELKDKQFDIIHLHNIHGQISYGIIPVAGRIARRSFITFHDTMSVHYGKIFPKTVLHKDGTTSYSYKVGWFEQLKYARFRWNPFRNILIRHYLKKIDGKIAVSHSLKEALEENGLSNIEVVYNGINLNGFAYNKEDTDAFKKRFYLEDKKVMFLGGRISGAKGGMVALNTLIALAKEFGDICLIVAGKDNDYTRKLKNIAIKNGIGEKLVVTGWLDRKEIVAAYYSSNIVLIPSLYLDPLPTISLEAGACKRAVLGTIFGGTKEVIDNNKCGFIVDPNREQDMYNTAKNMLNLGKINLDEMGNNLNRKIKDEFSLDVFIDKMLKMYSSVEVNIR